MRLKFRIILNVKDDVLRDIIVDSSTSLFEFSKIIVSTNEIDSLSSGEILSPMHGVISQVKVANNKKVSKGETLFILEAMKMQHEIKANIDGLTSEIRVKENSQVSTGDLLVKISP